MRRPVWAGSRMFTPAWLGAVGQLNSPLRYAGVRVLSLLEEARVVVVPDVQMCALPGLEKVDDIADSLAHEHLPFKTTFIDFGVIESKRLWGSGALEGSFAGLLLTETHQSKDTSGPGVMGFVDIEGTVVSDGTLHRAVAVDGRYTMLANFPPELPKGLVDAESDGPFGDLAARVLRFLNCINVDLIDAPMSRQERRAAERKDSRIAQIVYIRQNHKHKEPAEHQKIDWSHRWEVRGHYKHFPQGTQLANAAPEKLSWEPRRQEYVRRIWCPPYVKGPADLPLIPKTHVVRV